MTKKLQIVYPLWSPGIWRSKGGYMIFRFLIIIFSFLCHNSAPRARIQTKYIGHSSYKHPGASFSVQGPQKQSEFIKTYFTFPLHSLCIPLHSLYMVGYMISRYLVMIFFQWPVFRRFRGWNQHSFVRRVRFSIRETLQQSKIDKSQQLKPKPMITIVIYSSVDRLPG